MFNKLRNSIKKEAVSNPISISIAEKQFYLSLYNSLPTDYSLAFHSDVINLNSLIMKNKNNFSKGCVFLEKFNDQLVDFIVLDYSLQPCAVILFDYPKGSKLHSEFHEHLINLGVPVFVYSKEDKYIFKDLLMFLQH